jgi:hypothetical protein
MNTFVIELLSTLTVASALALWNGWGITRLLLPATLQPWRAILAPLIGYALTVLTGYWVVRFFSGLGLALGLLLPICGVLNWLAWRRLGPPRILTALHQHWTALLIGFVGIAIGIAPLLSYGYSAPIGEGWDIENYWPTARYLTRGPVSAIATAPPNPLRDLNASPPRIGLTLGFSIWQGSVDLLSSGEPLTSFGPLLAWLRALGGIGLYILLQSVFDLRRWSATLGALLAVLNGLLLWVSFFNFGMQIAAWPLIPLVIILGLHAVQSMRFGEGLLVAAIAIAAVPITYYPALGPLGLMAAGIGAVRLWQQHERRLVLKQSIGLILLALVLAAPTIPDYFAGFNYRYSLPLTTLGLFRFVPLSDIVGLTLFRLRDAPETLTPLTAIAACTMFLLAGYAVMAAPQRSRWLGMVTGAALFLLTLRFVSVYHYGYLKAAAYLGWIVSALAVAGLQVLSERLSSQRQWLYYVVMAGTIMLIGGPITFTAGRVVADHWGKPGLFAGVLPALRDLRQVVPPGSTVFLSGDPRVQGVTSALAAYLLDHAAVYGSVRTGYATSTATTSTGIGEYVLLQRDEDPRLWGLTDPPIWRGGPYLLYRKPDTLLAYQPLDQLLTADQITTLTITAHQLAGHASLLDDERAERWLILQVATLKDSKLLIKEQTYNVPAGRHWISIGPLTTPQTVTIRQPDPDPVLLQSAMLTAKPPAILGQLPHSIVLSATSNAQDLHITTTLVMLNPDSGPVVAAIELWDNQHGYLFGRYGLRMPLATVPREVAITIDLGSGTAIAQDSTGATLPLGIQSGGAKPGSYTARLWIGTDQRALLTPVDLFAFTIHRSGMITLDWVAQHPLMMTSIDRPLNVLDTRIGEDMLLHGYDLSTEQIAAGDTIAIRLWWESLHNQLDERSIMLHLRNSADERIIDADGPPASGGRPTTQWRTGEVIIDDRRLTIPADLPPGRYWLVIGSYRWPSLEPLVWSDTSETGRRIPIEVQALPTSR